MKSYLALFIVAVIWMFMAGVIGDIIFFPHPEEWSFRVFSNYTDGLALFVAAIVTYYNRKKP